MLASVLVSTVPLSPDVSPLQMLSLDKTVSDSVDRLRRNAFKLLHVEEYDPRTASRPSRPSWVVPGIVCPGCGDARDVDACLEARPGDGGWACPRSGCGVQADMDEVEGRLLADLRGRWEAWQGQDLR